MDSTNTSNDFNSIFKYDEAKKYFEKLDSCNTNDDCPGNSYCIGNKCMVRFYCKKGDKSTCGLFDTFCDLCNKKTISCSKNDECAADDLCSQGGYCLDKSHHSEDYTEYIVGKFTYENVQKLDIQRNIYCNENNSTCSFSKIIKDGISQIGEYECNSNDECVSNYCKKNSCKKVILSNSEGFGLENGNKCTSNWKCHSNHCALGSFAYQCREPSDSEGMVVIVYIPIFGILFCIIMGLLAWIGLRVKRYYNEKDSRGDKLINEPEVGLVNKNQNKQD